MTDLIPGIYKIESLIHPERVYVGSAIDLSKRKNTHFEELRKNKHSNKRLQNHYNKYGKEDLIYSPIHCCLKDELIIAEQFFIDSYRPFFNICKVAGSCLGIKHSPEAVEKNRQSKLGKKTGPCSEERKRKIREWNTGRKMTDEDKKKMSDARKGKSPWNKGTHGLYTEEYKAKLRKKRKTFRHTEESKKKISESQIGHVGYNTGMPAWNKGIKMSPEFCAKMSEVSKGRIPGNKGKKFYKGKYIDKDVA